jgi:hypothetical protein
VEEEVKEEKEKEKEKEKEELAILVDLLKEFVEFVGFVEK